jgi:type IV pilus assembly protein PilC
MFGISSSELVHLTKNLSLMLKSGMTIDETLAELAEETGSNRIKKTLLAVRHDIQSGLSLHQALEKHPRIFGEVMRAVVKAGETSGTLEENLSFLAGWLEHNADIKREVRGAMIYPAIVFIATIGLSAGLSLLVLPRMLPIFSQMKGGLPTPTKILLFITDTMQKDWFFVLIGLGLLVAGFVTLGRVLAVRRVLHRIYLHVPFVGKMLREYQLTLIGQLFATLSRSGLSIYEVIDVTSGGATNLTYREALAEAGMEIQKGVTLSEALKRHQNLFPRDMTSILAVGERSGSLEESFQYLTEYYRKEVYAATKRLPTVVEPILLLLMGLLVAFIAISIILPIYQFTSNVHHS